MERKIGEIFEYNGEWYQCVEAPIDEHSCNGCQGCKGVGGPRIFGGECDGNARKDRKFVIFKKLEKVGEPYTHYCPSGRIIYFQKYKLFNKLYSHNTGYIMCDFNEDGIVSIEIKQNKEDMEEKKQKLGKLVDDYMTCRIQYAEFEKGIRELYEKRSNSEKIGKNLKPFDLQKAKAGKSVCTRDGRKARIICFDKKGNRPIVALIENSEGIECVAYYNEKDIDLMMLPEKKEGWVNVYNNPITHNIYTSADVFESKEIAEELGTQINRIATCKITWEE